MEPEQQRVAGLQEGYVVSEERNGHPHGKVKPELEEKIFCQAQENLEDRGETLTKQIDTKVEDNAHVVSAEWEGAGDSGMEQIRGKGRGSPGKKVAKEPKSKPRPKPTSPPGRGRGGGRPQQRRQ